YWGAEANGWANVFHDCPGTIISVDMMAGFRYLDLDQNLDLGAVSVFSPTIPATSPFRPFAGDALRVADSFSTHNRFYGGQVGVAGRWWPFTWMRVDGTAK